MNSEIRLLIVDPHLIVRSGVRTLLSTAPDLLVVGESAYGAEALQQATYLKPHVILVNLRLPDMDGLETIRYLHRVHPGCKTLVLTSHCDEQQVRGAIQAGASGYLLYDVGRVELIQAIRATVQGQPSLHPEAQRVLMRQMAQPEQPHPKLTTRDMDVLRLLTQGKCNKEIAATLYLTEGTVKGYVSVLLNKLKVADRTQAALYAVKHQMV